MAVKLAERVVDALVAILKSDLDDELGAINTDRSDGSVLDVPPDNAYYKRPMPVIEGGTAHVEVYESAMEFDDPYTDQDAQRFTGVITCTVNVTWFNRNNESRQSMVTKGRRYSTAVFNVINKNPQLDATDGSIKGSVVSLITPAWEGVSEEIPTPFKGSVAIEIITKIEENQA